MTVYIVTSSADYYPCSGIDDWQSVHADEAEARDAFDAHPQDGTDVFLIAVDPPEFKVLAEK